MIQSSFVDNELSRIGALQLLEDDNPKEAAELIYRWLLMDSVLEADVDDVSSPNLYEMLSYLLDMGTTFGFTYQSRIERECLVFTITNNTLQENNVVPILLESLTAYVFEQLSNIQPDVTQSGNDIIVRIKMPTGT